MNQDRSSKDAMSKPINRMTLRGFKSIQSLEGFQLHSLNVLIGANGSGKSNFVSFFSLLREMVKGGLEKAINKAGGADVHLFNGPKVTEKIEADLEFGMNGYGCVWEPTADNRLIFADERIRYHAEPGMRTRSVDISMSQGHSESMLKKHAKEGCNATVAQHVYEAVSSWTVYHFHDTSTTAAMRRTCSARDNERLRESGSNLAAFLYRLRDEKAATYSMIVDTIRLVAPFFEDFKLRPKKRKDDQSLELEWTQKNSDYPFHASQLSDGTIRFIALTTALLQPDPPATILVDEPELGLHPYAIALLADLFKSAAERTQVVISTQSATLLDYFEPEEVVVVSRAAGQSTFLRLNARDLSEWISDYSVGELWQKNVVQGGPTSE